MCEGGGGGVGVCVRTLTAPNVQCGVPHTSVSQQCSIVNCKGPPALNIFLHRCTVASSRIYHMWTDPIETHSLTIPCEYQWTQYTQLNTTHFITYICTSCSLVWCHSGIHSTHIHINSQWSGSVRGECIFMYHYLCILSIQVYYLWILMYTHVYISVYMHTALYVPCPPRAWVQC